MIKLKRLLVEYITSSQLKKIEQYLDNLWDYVGIDIEFTRHFLDRVNDYRNIKEITPAEVIRLFQQTYKKYGKSISKLGDHAEAVLKDMRTDVNVPFVLKWDPHAHEFEMVAKTIMRKKDFKTSNKKFSV